MKARALLGTLLLMVLALCANTSFPQTPQGFSYQALIRDGSGNPIVNKTIGMRITLENTSGVAYYTETHTPSTNEQGVISVIIGGGTIVGTNTFTNIPWKNGDLFVKVEIDPNGGSSYSSVGTHTKLQSVPYALFAENAKEVVSKPDATDDDPIFVVRNKEGKIVFAVYQTGVRVYVEDSAIKGTKGGFAVGGLSGQSKGEVEYFRITPDSARIFINETPSVKGTKGGFAVGGLSGLSKIATSRNLMFVALDSTRIYIDSSKAIKGTKGGFAVGGLSGLSKSSNCDLLKVTADSTRIYVKKTLTKGTKGGFAVGGLSGLSKAPSSNFLDLTPENYFIGEDAGKNVSTGKYNSFFGYQSGYINTTGGYNIFLGYHTGYNNNSNYNIFMGFESGYKNTSGSNNTFIGYQAGRNHYLNNHNVYIGNSSGYTDSSGYYNVFIGYKAGYASKTGYFNVVIGNDAGGSALKHRNCVYIGNNAGKYRTIDGFSNVYIGNISGQYGDGDYNVFVGDDAGSTVTGDNNTGLGKSVGKGTTGSNNLFLGSTAGYLLGSVSNRVILGNSSITTFFCQGAYAATTASAANLYVNSSGQIMRSTSSRRYKSDITDLTINTSSIYKLHPVSFLSLNDKSPSFGLIAEEVAEVIPELAEFAVEKQVVPGSNSDRLIPDAVKYPLLPVLLLSEMQKHEQKINELTSKIDQLHLENSSLKDQLNDVKSKFESLKSEIEAIKVQLNK